MLIVWGSAGVDSYDLCVADSCVIPSRGKGIMDTRLGMSLSQGTYPWIAPCLGLAIWNFIDVGSRVGDLDYWGKIKVVLFNHSAEDFAI